MGQTTDDRDGVDSRIVYDAVTGELHLGSSDRVVSAGFEDDTGKARATVVYDSCMTRAQVNEVRDSDTWVLSHVYSNGSSVRVHLFEDLGDE